jgi:hypothetical protein
MVYGSMKGEDYWFELGKESEGFEGVEGLEVVEASERSVLFWCC